MISNNDHALRHINSEQYEGDQVFGTAFQLRLDKGEKELSVYWQELYSGLRQGLQIEEVRNEVNANRTVKDSHRLARINVGKTIEYIHNETDDGRLLEFIHTPETDSPSHSSVLNIEPVDEINFIIAELISDTVIDLYLAK